MVAACRAPFPLGMHAAVSKLVREGKCQSWKPDWSFVAVVGNRVTGKGQPNPSGPSLPTVGWGSWRTRGCKLPGGVRAVLPSHKGFQAFPIVMLLIKFTVLKSFRICE